MCDILLMRWQGLTSIHHLHVVGGPPLAIRYSQSVNSWLWVLSGEPPASMNLLQPDFSAFAAINNHVAPLLK